ncbi:MAG TPA: Tat pathway signal sequence domain protein [Opitutaceae bacterium]|nr:Tat pathway signal sequence domain protein [Opitutaceae bacterium]
MKSKLLRAAPLFALLLTLVPLTRAASAEPVSLNWLGGKVPAARIGVSWGVPWPRGAVSKTQAFALTNSEGQALPLQNWPLAYWPDGSVKWSGFATATGGGTNPAALRLSLAAGAPATDGPRIQVRRSDTTFEVDTGAVRARITKWGGALIDSLTVDGREVARQGRLVCVVQNGADGGVDTPPVRETFTSKVQTVTVEQSGPVRAVVKIEGMHRGTRTSREWLPFVVRLYFYAGQAEIRLVHTIVYDGDQEKDFIRGLGLEFDVPMREQIHNRHVRFAGEGEGVWSEPIQPMIGRHLFVAHPTGGTDVYPDQAAGRRVPNKEEYNFDGQKLLTDWAVWDSFKLTQLSSDGFVISKRTNPASAWIRAGAGKRSAGLAFVGDASGGLGVSVKNFWQSYPASLEVANARSGSAALRVWLWSPDGEAMDMRHYDVQAHGLEAVYEDVQPGFSTATGVARTSELTLWPRASTPLREEVAQLARAGAEPPLLVCTPQYLHAQRAFGIWSVQDRSTPFKSAIEDQLDAAISIYKNAVDQHHWYGFWDFGDIMHSYDFVRHEWRYDLGGMAWDNTELGSDIWLWFSFLRTGRADIFRMAEAMTRHTSEVDVYHLGRFASLGSRHNVRHWGCGAKEARISMAPLKRYFYYLTTDERTGDLMREVLDADARLSALDPMRLAQPITEAEKKYPGRIRGGPDWLAFAGNWMTEWERTGDVKWRDKILAGMNSLAEMPYWFRSGKNLVYGYDPATGKLYRVSEEIGNYNLTTIMGGAQIAFELNELIEHDTWKKMWLQYCRLEMAPADVVLKDKTTGNEGADAAYTNIDRGAARLAAYVYLKTKNPAFAQRAIKDLTGGWRDDYSLRRIEPPFAVAARDEAEISTNNVAQSSLTLIEVLEMCADKLPTAAPPADPARAGPVQGLRPGPAGNSRTKN